MQSNPILLISTGFYQLRPGFEVSSISNRDLSFVVLPSALLNFLSIRGEVHSQSDENVLSLK